MEQAGRAYASSVANFCWYAVSDMISLCNLRMKRGSETMVSFKGAYFPKDIIALASYLY